MIVVNVVGQWVRRQVRAIGHEPGDTVHGRHQTKTASGGSADGIPHARRSMSSWRKRPGHVVREK